MALEKFQTMDGRVKRKKGGKRDPTSGLGKICGSGVRVGREKRVKWERKFVRDRRQTGRVLDL